MKKCPVCESICFDDMEICFGCMHRFVPSEPEGAQVSGGVQAMEQQPASLEPQAATALESQAAASAKQQEVCESCAERQQSAPSRQDVVPQPSAPSKQDAEPQPSTPSNSGDRLRLRSLEDILAGYRIEINLVPVHEGRLEPVGVA